MKQATYLKCKQSFSFKMGRKITFKENQLFWVTNSEADQNNRKLINIARKNQKIGYDFSIDEVQTFFVEV